MKWGYHLPHLRSGDLNPGSLGSLPRAPQGVGRAGSEPRWVTPHSSLWLRVPHGTSGSSRLCDRFLKSSENSSGHEFYATVNEREAEVRIMPFRAWSACSQIPQDSSDAIVSKAIDLWHKHCGTPVHSA